MIQSVLFNKKYFTKEESKNWLVRHKLNPIKPVHETKNNYRYRLLDPKMFKYFRTRKISLGIDLVIGSK